MTEVVLTTGESVEKPNPFCDAWIGIRDTGHREQMFDLPARQSLCGMPQSAGDRLKLA